MSFHPFKHLFKSRFNIAKPNKDLSDNPVKQVAKVSVSAPSKHDSQDNNDYKIDVSKNGFTLSDRCFKYFNGKTHLRFMACDNQPAIMILPADEKPFAQLKKNHSSYKEYYDKALLKNLLRYCQKAKTPLDLKHYHYSLSIKLDRDDDAIIASLGNDLKSFKNKTVKE